MLVVATISPRSQAAGKDHDAPPRPAASARSTGLLPLLAKREVPVFGSFIKPGSAQDVLPSEAACPPDMTEVEGEYCPFVEQRCLRWLDPPTKLQCAEFDKTTVSAGGKCTMKTEHKKFCIDRYEWPNKVGVVPRYMASWVEAKATCEGIGKRLCGDTEWTLACEGPQHQPYPYGEGFARDDAACNIDKPYIMPDDAKWANPHTRPEEIARLDQRDPSGARESCVSPYGVHDMTGNVDEWVTNEKGKEKEKPYVSGLKGGYWGPVRDRCRPMTTDHNQWHTGYQIGFRCCEDVPSAPASTEPSSVPAPTPAVPART